MAVSWLLVLSIVFLAVALARFAVALGDDRFIASTRQASKAAYGFGIATTLFALPLIDVATGPSLVPLGIFALSGLFLAPPTRRHTFGVTVVAFVAVLLGAGAYAISGSPFGWILALPVALVLGHAPLPGRPSVRFLIGLPLGLALVWVLPTPLLLAPVPLLLLGLPHGAPYPILGEDPPWDHRMLYYLGLLGVAIATMLALNAGPGGPLVDPSIDRAQVTLALIGAGILLVLVFKAGFLAVQKLGAANDPEGS